MFNKTACTVICIFLVSCSGLRYLPEGEKLYTGAQVELLSSQKFKDKKKFLREAEKIVSPKPNKSFLGIRPGLWLYGVAGNPKKGLRKWIKTKLGEPPVLFSTVQPEKTYLLIDARLYNRGMFKAVTTFTINEKKKTAGIRYTTAAHPPFIIDTVFFPRDKDALSMLIASQQANSLVKPGDNYNLDILTKERERIDEVLKDNGYYFFDPDQLLFKGDTSETNNTVTVALGIKDKTPHEALRAYRIDSVSVDMSYTIEKKTTLAEKDTLVMDDVKFYFSELKIKPPVILRSVFLKENELYSKKNHQATLNHLISMENFKFVNLKFEKNDSIHPGYLNADIRLNFLPRRTFDSDLSLVTKSNDFIGPQLTVSYKNRNTFRGAERLNLTLSGSIETQFSGKYKGLYSYEISPKAELIVPLFIQPFKIKNSSIYNIPKTKFSIGYSFLHRIDYYDLTSLQLVYGFNWKKNIKQEHELYPININFTSIFNESEQFSEMLEENPYLKESYEEQFIAGVFYSYTYNEQAVEHKKNQFYLNTTAELSGNALSLIKNVFENQKPTPENPLSVAGYIYSQFARWSLDMREHLNFKKENSLVLRLYTGIGKAYGNSSQLPYIRQFFSGGPNSIRAFEINSLGPGTYRENADQSTAFVEQGGDIKLEANAEYRNNLVGFLKGAVFIDAGNNWLLKENPSINSEPFSFSRFYKEIAVGTGIGLRIDASFFVVRFDLAFPLRKPWLEEGSRWVIDEIDPGSSAWRKDNLVLNVAIGYPF
ncbi:MAG: BamA/TamA family outer membrane protein [Bacteroidia bacterium]